MKICSIISCLLATLVHADPIRIDLGMDTGRNDTAAPGWIEWQVPDGRSARQDFGALTVVLEGTSNLKGQWYKKGLASGAIMATDGVTIMGNGNSATLELRIRGLAPGRHSLVTYHNGVENDPYSAVYVAPEDGTESHVLEPSYRVASDIEARHAYIEFEVEEGRDAVIRISGKDAAQWVILNGIEIDGVDPDRKALDPFPRDSDLHIDGDSGEVELRWQPSKHSVKHQVYLAHAGSRQEARELLRDADPSSPAYVATVPNNRQVVKVDNYNTQPVYAWRVDSIDKDERITRGDSWTFRVRQLAFPGAEGWGRFAIGGRGGRVIKVTNLNDSGPGSLRAAIEAEGPRTVIFDVSGRIILKDRLVIRNPYLTIAGHTAPGKGICISNFNLGMLGTQDVIIRHLRVRPGNTSGKTLDGMGMASCDHCIIDHCSISWTQDEAFSSRGAKNITLQRTLISEALNIAGHKKYKKGSAHGFAASISGDIGSFHHNLLAHCAGRNWSLAGGLDKAGVHAGRLDIRNNVVYNFGYRTTDGGAMEVNFVNNYYKPGPATTVFHVLKPERNHVFGPQDYYVFGNVMEGHYGADEHYAGIVEPRDEPMGNFLVDEPFFQSHVTTQTAREALDSVFADVGANVPMLDEHDRRVIVEARTGTYTYTGSISGLPGLPDSQEDVGGWEEYPVVHRPDDWDVDNDGIPGEWESAHGLNPEDPSDGPVDPDGDGYTNLEAYLHSVVGLRSQADSLEKKL